MNNGNDKLTINCPHCGQRFSIPSPKTQIVNMPTVSMAVTVHEKPIKCICGGSSVVVIQQTQTAWAIMPLTTEQAGQIEGSKIITPPPGMRLVH